MKISVASLLVFSLVEFTQTSHGYPQAGTPTSGGMLNNGLVDAAIAQQQYNYAVQAQQRAELARATAYQQAILQRIHSKDTWRVVDGVTNYAGGDGWLEFQGLPQEACHDGTIFKGKCGAPLTVVAVRDANHFTASQSSANSQAYKQKYIPQNSSGIQSYRQAGTAFTHGITDTSVSDLNYGDDIFIVANFPYPPTQPYVEMLAHEAGYYTFTNTDDQAVTIHKLDYGTPCVKLWSAKELEAIKERSEAPRKAAEAKALKSNQEMADKGDAYGLLRMGERYRDGDGVEPDLTKARMYLRKAVDAGSTTAAEELRKLPDDPIESVSK